MPKDAKPKQTGSGGDKARLLSLSDLDRRTRAYQHTRETLSGIVADLGGEEHLSTVQLALAESLAVMSAMVRDQEVRFLAGEEVDLASYVALVNARRREAQAVGLERRARDVTPSLRDYIAGKAGSAS